MEPAACEVRPREELRDFAEPSFDAHHFGILMRPVVWELPDMKFWEEEMAGSTGWGPEEFLLLVKLAHLSSLADLGLIEEPFGDVFDTTDLTPGLFDRWWTVSTLDSVTPPPGSRGEGLVDYIHQMLAGDIASGRVPPTGNSLVDEWLKSYGSPRG